MDHDFAATQFCYLTTKGRKTGNPHTIEIWFGQAVSTLYLLAGSGEKADWVRNLRSNPQVSLRIDEVDFVCTARIVVDADEDQMARDLLVEKYQSGYEKDLTDWGRTSLPVGLEIDSPLD